MVYCIPPLAASLINTTAPEQPSGKGVVEEQIDESTFVIRLAAGKVTVRVPEGSLVPGEPVNLSFRGDQVLIERLQPQAGGGENISYLLELSLGPKIDELAALLKDLRSSLPPDTMPELLRGLDAAIASLTKPDADARTLLQVVRMLQEEILPGLGAAGPGASQDLVRKIAELVSSIVRNIPNLPDAGREQFLVNQSFVLTLPPGARPEPAFLYAGSKPEAVSLLMRHVEAPDPAAAKFFAAVKDEPLFIRFYASAHGETRAVIMPRHQAILEIQHFLRCEMQSPVMQKLDPVFLADMIARTGSVAVSPLMEIDRLLALASPAGVPLIKEDAMAITLPQLVSVALESGIGAAVDLKAAVTRIGASVPALVLEIAGLLQKNGDAIKLPDIIDTVMKNMSLENSGRKEDLVSLLFKSMGYSFESDLGTLPSASPAGLQENTPSLKLVLLLILGAVNAIIERDGAAAKVGAGSILQEKDAVAPDTQTAPLKAQKSLQSQAEQAGRDQPQRISAGMIRQQIETALNHIESLQVLAKPVTTHEGQQQVLVLPLNIGNEWVEMRVKFVKERDGRSGGNRPKRVSVVLNVDLALLGGVTAAMEYEPKKSLNVSCTFETVQAYRWFQKNKKEFVEAMTGLGFPSVQVRLSRTTDAGEKSGFGPQQAMLDVTG